MVEGYVSSLPCFCLEYYTYKQGFVFPIILVSITLLYSHLTDHISLILLAKLAVLTSFD